MIAIKLGYLDGEQVETLRTKFDDLCRVYGEEEKPKYKLIKERDRKIKGKVYDVDLWCNEKFLAEYFRQSTV